MKTNRLLSTMTAALLVAVTPALTLAQVQRATPQALPRTEVVRACSGVERSLPLIGALSCGSALQTSLESNNADLMALLMAARGIDKTDKYKLILIKHGLTMQQLDGAEIVLRDETGGAGATRIKSITITCCPLTITIVF